MNPAAGNQEAPAKRTAPSREKALRLISSFDESIVWLDVLVEGTWIKVIPFTTRLHDFERQMASYGVTLLAVEYTMWRPRPVQSRTSYGLPFATQVGPIKLQKPGRGYMLLNHHKDN